MFRNIVFNNIRCMIGQTKNGVQLGGDVLLNHMNIINPYNIININRNQDYKKCYDIVSTNLHNKKLNINIGGDHSIAVSTIQPNLDKYGDDLLVIWIDAHSDINTYKSSNTKNTHGMPLSTLLGYMPHWYNKPQYITNFTKLKKKNLMYVGLRDMDLYEKELIDRKKILYFTDYTPSVINMIENTHAQFIHISCDIDSMDPNIMPSTGTPVNNGLLLEDVIKIINTSKNKLVGFDLVEFNPLIGSRKDVNKTLNNISKIINTIY